MLKFILSTIFFVVMIILFGLSAVRKTEGETVSITLIPGLLCTVLFIGSCTFSIVPAGKTGVLVTNGRVSDTIMTSGAHFKIPFAQSIVMIDNRVQRTDVEGGGSSKDLQKVSANVSVNYRVLSTASASIYKTVGTDWDTVVVRPAVQECMKAVMSRYTAEEMIVKRSEMGDAIAESIAEKVSVYGIEVDAINILNMEFSAEFDAAVEAKQTAQQEAQKAAEDLERIRVEAEQTVVAAQAEADANRIRTESITNEILIADFISKWDGKLPAVMGGSETMLDITSAINQ